MTNGWAVEVVTGNAALDDALVSGRIRIAFRDGREALLDTPGAYALWAPGVAHRCPSNRTIW
jgi:hypothetical protein